MGSAREGFPKQVSCEAVAVADARVEAQQVARPSHLIWQELLLLGGEQTAVEKLRQARARRALECDSGTPEAVL